MPIRIEYTGGAKEAGIAAGIERAQQVETQRQIRQTALEWEQHKMFLNSQQDFAHEMRLRQAELDREARAQEWHTEKMELVSRMDFEQKEKERVRRKAEYKTGKDVITTNDTLTDAQRDEANFLLAKEYIDVSDAAADLGRGAERQPSISEQRQQLLSPEEQREASLISAGLTPRAARPKTEYDRIKQIDELTRITSSFEEDAEVNPPGWWNKKTVPLAVRDEDGNLVEATPEEVQLYDASIAELDRMRGIKIPYPDFVTEEDQPKYDLLIQKGWTPEAIRTTLGK